MVRFIVTEEVPLELVETLRGLGHEVTVESDAGAARGFAAFAEDSRAWELQPASGSRAVRVYAPRPDQPGQPNRPGVVRVKIGKKTSGLAHKIHDAVTPYTGVYRLIPQPVSRPSDAGTGAGSVSGR